MKIVYNDGFYLFQVKLQNSVSGSSILMDTGSNVSVLTLKDLRLILGYSNISVNTSIQHVLGSITGHRVFSTTYCIRNVIIGGTLVKEFKFYVPHVEGSIKDSVIGMDFIQFLSGTLKAQNDINIVGFDYEYYQKEWSKRETPFILRHISELN